MVDPDQAERIADLYAEALSNYDELGRFQLALSNCMAYRSFNWEADRFEKVLKFMVEVDAETLTPKSKNQMEFNQIVKGDD